MNTLKAETRTKDVKAKKLRREGYITGNLFGREIDGSILLNMSARDVDRLLKTDNKGSQIMLNVEGKEYDVLIKEVQYNPLASKVEEMDFQALVSTEKVHSVAEIILQNTEGIAEGVLQEELTEISYEALPADLVDKIKIDVSSMKIGDTLRVGDLDIAKNEKIHLKTDENALIAMVTAVHNIVADDTAEDEAEEAAEAAVESAE